MDKVILISSSHYLRYLQGMQPFPEGFHMELKEYIAAINSGDTVLRGWDTVVVDKQFFHHLGRGQDEYIVDKVRVSVNPGKSE